MACPVTCGTNPAYKKRSRVCAPVSDRAIGIGEGDDHVPDTDEEKCMGESTEVMMCETLPMCPCKW